MIYLSPDVTEPITKTLIGPIPDDVVSTIAYVLSWVFLLSVAPLCVATVQKKASPSPIMWGTWFFSGMVSSVGLLLAGTPLVTWLGKTALSVGPLIVAVVALFCGVKLVATTVDKVCGIIAVLGLIGYCVVYFGENDPIAAAWVSVTAVILIDSAAIIPGWYDAYNSAEPIAEIVTFVIALAAVIAALCILPWPWALLSCTLFIFLGLQMVSMIVVLQLGRVRHQRGLAVPVD